MSIIKASNITKNFYLKNTPFHVLTNINLEVNQGEFIIILGDSGSGKTTLLNILGLLDNCSSGELELFGKNIKDLSQREKQKLIKENISYVFQAFYLFEHLNVYENIVAGTSINKEKKEEIYKILESVGILEDIKKYPKQLSGGMRQRVAIARAILKEPKIIFADEPTGNLDYRNGTNIINLLKKINVEKNITILLVTHNKDYVKYADRVIYLKDGEII